VVDIDEMPPLVHLPKMVRVISLVRQQGAKRQALDQLFRAGDFASLPRHQRKPRKVAQSVDKREDFARNDDARLHRRARAVDQYANVVDVLILRHILQMCDQLELFAVRLAQAQ